MINMIEKLLHDMESEREGRTKSVCIYCGDEPYGCSDRDCVGYIKK